MKRREFINKSLAISFVGLIEPSMVILPRKQNHEKWGIGNFVKHPTPLIEPNPKYTFHCPILDKKVKWQAQNVYNPAAIVKEDKVYLLFRADDKTNHKYWPRTCRAGLAWSEDGINFNIHPEPVIFPDSAPTP